MQFAGPAFTFPLTREQLEKSVNDENRHTFTVVDSFCNKAIGHAEIYLTWDCAYLGRILIGEQRLRGQGTGKQIVFLLLDYAFTELNRQKVQLNVFDWNIPAIKCYEKAGFDIIPGKTAQRIVNGQTWTVLSMAIDSEKWKRLQQR
jgi:RimJ/RimL family protein N-acetyltransferase